MIDNCSSNSNLDLQFTLLNWLYMWAPSPYPKARCLYTHHCLVQHDSLLVYIQCAGCQDVGTVKVCLTALWPWMGLLVCLVMNILKLHTDGYCAIQETDCSMLQMSTVTSCSVKCHIILGLYSSMTEGGGEHSCEVLIPCPSGILFRCLLGGQAWLSQCDSLQPVVASLLPLGGNVCGHPQLVPRGELAELVGRHLIVLLEGKGECRGRGIHNTHMQWAMSIRAVTYALRCTYLYTII